MHAKSIVAVVVLVLGCGAGIAAKPPQESPQELLRKAAERIGDLQHGGPMTLRYALRFSDGRTGTFLWRQRDGDNFRQDLQIGSLAASQGAVGGKSWKCEGDEAVEAWWLVSTLREVRNKLEPDDVDVLKVHSRRVGDSEFLEVGTNHWESSGGWVVFLSSPDLDFSLSERGFLRCAYVDWKKLSGAGMVPGGCRIYLQDGLGLEMTLDSGTNKPIDEAELTPPSSGVMWVRCLSRLGPRRVNYAPLTYPEEARLARAQGSVVVAGTIGLTAA